MSAQLADLVADLLIDTINGVFAPLGSPIAYKPQRGVVGLSGTCNNSQPEFLATQSIFKSGDTYAVTQVAANLQTFIRIPETIQKQDFLAFDIWDTTTPRPTARKHFAWKVDSTLDAKTPLAPDAAIPPCPIATAPPLARTVRTHTPITSGGTAGPFTARNGFNAHGSKGVDFADPGDPGNWANPSGDGDVVNSHWFWDHANFMRWDGRVGFLPNPLTQNIASGEGVVCQDRERNCPTFRS